MNGCIHFHFCFQLTVSDIDGSIRQTETYSNEDDGTVTVAIQNGTPDTPYGFKVNENIGECSAVFSPSTVFRTGERN